MRTVKFTLKQILGVLFYALGGAYILKRLFKNKNRLIVLNYHNFSKYNNYKINRGSISETGYKNNFERQINFLNRFFNFCYPEDFFSRKSKKGLNVLITFDDGYKDNYDIAAPILAKYKTSTIFFLATNYIGAKNWLWHDRVRYLIQIGILKSTEAEGHLRKMNLEGVINQEFKEHVDARFPKDTTKRMMMNWNEVKEVNEMSIKLGAHTCNHVNLQQLNYSEQIEELEKSCQAIENITKLNCDYFAYPNGLYNTDTIIGLNSLNVTYAFTTVPGINNIDSDRTQLKRIGINVSDSVYTLLLKLTLTAIK